MIPALLRAVLLGLLAVALLLLPRGEGGRAPGVLVLPAPGAPSGDVDAAGPVLRSALADPPPALVVRTSTAPPDESELAILAVLSRRAPVIAALPADAPRVAAEPPARPLVGRAAGIRVSVRGAPGDTVPVLLADAAGPLDSARVVLDAAGVGAIGLRVRPAAPGWQEWTVSAAGETRRVGAWVRSAPPPRVLALSGPPSWEVRYAVRALEESGARVEVRQALGRGLAVGGDPDAARFAEYDVVLLFPGAELPARARTALAEHAAAGGGVLLVPPTGTGRTFGLPDAAGPLRTASGAGLRWRLPAELSELPAAEVEAAYVPLAASPAGAAPAAFAEPQPGVGPGSGGPGAGPAADELLALRPYGRGRAAALGLLDTWKWRVEAGQLEAHREFWRGLVDWLAGGRVDGPEVRAVAPIGATAEPVKVTAVPAGADIPPAATNGRPGASPADATPPALRLLRPGGRVEPLALVPDADGTGAFAGYFLPDTAGGHGIAADAEDEPRAGYAARDDVASHDAWARLAILAHASGGAMLPADSILARMAAAAVAHPAGSRIPWAFIAFLLLAGTALAEWAIRRLRGRT